MGERHEPPQSDVDRLAAYVRRRVASLDDADEIMQDAFLALYGRWNIGERIEDVLAWLFTVARRRIADWYRRRQGRPQLLPDAADADAGDLWELADARTETPGEEAERAELREAIMQAIAGLPDEQREVFLMTEVDGLAYREIAERTGVPLNTLLSRKRYAVLKLRRALEDYATETRGD
jgi:RNA polymerase sigma factor (sigma-70 family)